jgi:hypothetical protein
LEHPSSWNLLLPHLCCWYLWHHYGVALRFFLKNSQWYLGGICLVHVVEPLKIDEPSNTTRIEAYLCEVCGLF